MPELLSPSALRGLLTRHGIRPSRALGQCFLADPNTARRIVRLAGIADGDRVVEVGPGVGSLTLALCEAGAFVRAVEIDRYVPAAFAEATRGCAVELVQADALEVEWPALLADAPRWAMVANLPYNVARPLLLRALDTAPMIDRFFVMVQREFAQRLVARAGQSQYDALSVTIAYHGKAEMVGTVPSTVFVPRPNVESALVRITRHAQPIDVDERELFALVHASFATRRKSMRHSLRDRLGADVDAWLAAAGIEPLARAERVTLEQWIALAHVVEGRS